MPLQDPNRSTAAVYHRSVSKSKSHHGLASNNQVALWSWDFIVSQSHQRGKGKVGFVLCHKAWQQWIAEMSCHSRAEIAHWFQPWPVSHLPHDDIRCDHLTCWIQIRVGWLRPPPRQTDRQTRVQHSAIRQASNLSGIGHVISNSSPIYISCFLTNWTSQPRPWLAMFNLCGQYCLVQRSTWG